jgi:hypothetical protein
MHPGGAMHLLVDGSVRFISEDISDRVYVALATRSSGDAVEKF